METVILYLGGLLVVTNIMIVIRETDIFLKALRLFGVIPKNIFLWIDFEDYAIAKMGTLGELLICYLCLCSHLSGLTGVALVFLGAPLWFPLFTFLSYPFLSHFICKVVHKI